MNNRKHIGKSVVNRNKAKLITPVLSATVIFPNGAWNKSTVKITATGSDNIVTKMGVNLAMTVS